jgi:hypothetical protein
VNIIVESIEKELIQLLYGVTRRERSSLDGHYSVSFKWPFSYQHRPYRANIYDRPAVEIDIAVEDKVSDSTTAVWVYREYKIYVWC